MSDAIGKIATAALAAAVLVSACEQKDTPPASKPEKTVNAPAPAKEAPVVGTRHMGPPHRPALPLRLMESRLDTSGAGKITLPGETEARPLAAFGVNVCNTGWVMAGYVKNDGKLEPTPPLVVNLAEIPTVPFEYEASGGGTIAFDFDVFGWEKVKGRLEIKDQAGKTALSMDIDAMPISVHNDAELASSGCYTTGYYKVGPQVGGVAGLFDGTTSYQSRLRLDDQHDLIIDLNSRPIGRDPSKIYRASLDRVFAKPKTFPMRVYLERRAMNEKITAGEKVSADRMRIERTPLTKGELVGSFVKADEEGPVRWILKDVEMPDWTGPFAGKTVDMIKLETFLATDSPVVPLPRRPNWKMTVGEPDAGR